MAFVLKDGQGTLFKNDKDDNPARPDYRGEVMIAGTLYRLSGWIKDGQKGKWMSLSAEVPRAKEPEAPKAKAIDVDSDIQF